MRSNVVELPRPSNRCGAITQKQIAELGILELRARRLSIEISFVQAELSVQRRVLHKQLLAGCSIEPGPHQVSMSSAGVPTVA